MKPQLGRNRMRQAAIRAARTFVQTTLGVYLAGLVAAPALGDIANIDLLNASAAAGVVAVIAFAQNALEGLRDVNYDRG